MSTPAEPFLDGLDDIIIGLDSDGTPYPIGKLEAHQTTTRRHRAVSVFVLDGDRLLLQQRAAGKYHSPGLWANTACSHPLWEESAADCARRILRRELGLNVELRQFATVDYAAWVGDLYENEVVDCFVGMAQPGLVIAPDPNEVQATSWVSLDTLAADIAARPEAYAPWLKIYVEKKDMITALGGV